MVAVSGEKTEFMELFGVKRRKIYKLHVR